MKIRFFFGKNAREDLETSTMKLVVGQERNGEPSSI